MPGACKSGLMLTFPITMMEDCVSSLAELSIGHMLAPAVTIPSTFFAMQPTLLPTTPRGQPLPQKIHIIFIQHQ
ncbi:hypothetical protein HZ326_31451 [Fusarium oxysporum f. sp. albedinis]|nr:hypothetical protein HZ326_31451 [Fusarium oxysporum f. sp. albedinis]